MVIECCISSRETPQNLRHFLLYNAGSWVVSARFAISISLFLAKCFLADDFFVSSLYHLKTNSAMEQQLKDIVSHFALNGEMGYDVFQLLFHCGEGF